MQGKAPPRQTDRLSQGTRPRSGLVSWIRRGLMWTIAGLLTLALIGVIYQAIATQIYQRTYSPPGEMVDAGTHNLHINCLGEGSPTVILEAANLGMSAHWVRVQQQVAQATRVCAYDRAGLGWSERGPEPRDARQISSELHTLLKGADTDGPYVLAGHSYGGLYARMYAARYPEEVAGVVMVDSSHPEQFTRSPRHSTPRRNRWSPPLKNFVPPLKPTLRSAPQEAWVTNRSRSSVLVNSRPVGSKCKTSWPHSRLTASPA
jgi:pimeloyl-ACP methyl ester carboxylesterase